MVAIIFGKLVDLIFLVDVILMFMTAYYDDDFSIISDRKLIAINYLKTWFTIDILAIIPFEIFTNNNKGYNDIVRLARLSRMQKLIKMLRLVRIMKLFKMKNNFLKYA